MQFLDPGHSFVVFESYKDGVTINNIDRFYECYQPLDTYYNAVKDYNGTTDYDPVSYKNCTDGAEPTDENEADRSKYAVSLIKQIDPAVNESFTINKGEIAVFGCTTHEGTVESATETIYEGDYREILARNGVSTNGLLRPLKLITGLNKSVAEILFDLSLDYNPFDNENDLGGVCLNEEIRRQAYRYDILDNVCISTDITKTQLDAIIDYFQYENHFTFLGRNCTKTASDAWNIATASRPELHVEPNLGGVTTGISAPVFLQLSILSKRYRLSWDRSVDIQVNVPIIKANKDTLNQNYN